MEKHVKRKVLVAVSALALAGATVGGLAVAEQGTARHSAAARRGAAPAVRGQRVDLFPPPPTMTRRIHIEVKNYGAFVGGICLENSVKTNDCTPDVVADNQLNQSATEMVSTISGNADADVHGIADGGADAHIFVPVPETDVNADPPSHCFRFDGTTYIGFKFTKVSCDDFKTEVHDFTRENGGS